ncbi:YXWGXW repeat-containing protein, partial [bacterium]|nr:YXWGXW repeat-containing protein [bacterium]
MVQGLVLSLALAAGSSALAQVNFNIVLAPPPPVYEVVPMMPQGYVWAPGYWAWNHDRHIWMRGRSM